MQETLRKPISSTMEHRLNQIPSAAPYKFLSASIKKTVRDHHHFPESLQRMQGSSSNISKAEVPSFSSLSTAYTFNISKAALSWQNPPSRVQKRPNKSNLSLKQPCKFNPLKQLNSSPSPCIRVLHNLG